MMIDGTLSVMDIVILGKEDHGQDVVQLVICPAIGLPVGQNQVLPLQVAALRIPITKKTALQKAEELKAAAEQLPDERDLGDFTIAQNMTGVEKIAEADRQFKGKGKK